MTITLATLEQATAQEVFDQVARHLLTQKCKSFEETPAGGDPDCLYRGPNGEKCAAGSLIADNEYDVFWEGSGWARLVQLHFVPETHASLIRTLQQIHDSIPVEEWKNHLSIKADFLGLNSTVLDEFN